jgi:hypothetical protein
VILALLACPAEKAPLVCGDAADTEVAVISTLAFGRVADDGTSEGFDLDGTSDDVCDIPDYTSAGGEGGVDNAFARMIPALEATEAAAVEGLVQDAIESGELLLAVELSRVEDPMDDACVDVTMLRASGSPSMGTDGVMEWNQTFDRDPSGGESTVTGAVRREGAVEARPIDLDLPIQILNADFTLPIRDGAVRLVRDELGAYTGLMAGGVPVDALYEVASTENIDATLAAAIPSMIESNADLDADGDGVCESLSVTLAFTAVPAFFFEDEAVDTGG